MDHALIRFSQMSILSIFYSSVLVDDFLRKLALFISVIHFAKNDPLNKEPKKEKLK
jgi:hypothetical protein